MMLALLASYWLLNAEPKQPAGGGSTSVPLVRGTAAQDKAQAATAKVQAAQQEFSQGHFDVALKLLDSAAALTSDEDSLSRIQLLRGQCLAVRRDFHRAEEAFEMALAYDPEAELDASRVDPSLVRMLEGLRERLKGDLRVSVDRPDATLTVDGLPFPPAPARQKLKIGRHRVEAKSKDGKATTSHEVVVGYRRLTEVVLCLPVPAPPGELTAAEHETLGAGTRWFGELRGAYLPFEQDPVAMELGGGLGSKFARGSLSLRLFPAFGVTGRGAISVPIVAGFSGYLTAEIPLVFLQPTAVALGAYAGAEYRFGNWISGFLEIGGRHFFAGPQNLNQDQFVIQGGVRMWLPSLGSH